MKHRKEKKKVLIKEKEFSEMWENIKLFNVCATVVPER